jgi:glycolate oxidase FAD binding subunit
MALTIGDRRGGPSGPPDANAIDGVVPRQVIEPASAEDLAAALASASAQRASVVIRGGGTKIAWGRTPSSVDIVLGTTRLNKVVAHEYADLTATMQAGARIEEVNLELGRHGQWLPIESPFEGATIGGAIATNDGGPLRHRYGTPRDLVIGVRLALTDGRLIKAGGNVVKNVAGYDLGKLVSGSFGSLAAIVSATFKLTPLPAASSTLIATFDRADALVSALAAITNSQLEASAIEVRGGSSAASGVVSGVVSSFSRTYQLLLKFESPPGALNAHVQKARTLVGGATCEVVTSAAESDLWRDHSRSVWQSPGIIVKASWLPASLGGVLAFVEEMRGTATEVELVGRAALGSGLLRIATDDATGRAAVERMRARSDLFRYVVLLRASPELKQQVDVWGSLGDAAALGGAIKHALDPHGILNAGRGPV